MRDLKQLKKNLTAKTFSLVSCILFAMLLTTSLKAQQQSSIQLDPTINGENVGQVTELYRTTVKHTWTQTGAKTWIRTAAGSSKTESFQEYGRDEWSVYMKDGNNKNFQLDLWKKAAIDKSTGATGTIVKVGLNPKVIAVKRVAYNKNSRHAAGYFTQTSPKTWKEYKNGKTTVHGQLTEYARDQWSVYLKKADGLKVQLDLHRKEVIVNGESFYKITPEIDVTKVAYNRNSRHAAGYFTQTGPTKWKEYKNGKSAVHGQLTEYARDEWSVYLKKDDGLKVQLDLHRNKVVVNGESFYSITK